MSTIDIIYIYIYICQLGNIEYALDKIKCGK